VRGEFGMLAFAGNSEVLTIPGSEGVGVSGFEEDAADADDLFHEVGLLFLRLGGVNAADLGRGALRSEWSD
jgi:hypothetical protein